MTTAEGRKASAKKGIDEVVNKGNLAPIDDFFDTNYVGHLTD